MASAGPATPRSVPEGVPAAESAVPTPPERRRRGEGFSAFQKLEAQARRLETSMFFLIVLIAVAPPLYYALIEVRQLRARAAVHAEHVAAILEFYGQMPHSTLEGLARHLRVELEHDDLTCIQVFASDGREVLRLGQPAGWARPDAVEADRPGAAAPFARFRVRMYDENLKADIRRLVAIHLMVGLLLGLGIYRIPVRAFGQAIRELESAQAQLIHSNRLSALGSMYAGLTHEINNPLGILCARARLSLAMAREKGYDEELLKDLEVIDRQGVRIAEIMRSLLAFARKAEFSTRPVDLNSVVREVVNLVEKPFAKQGVGVRTELAPALPQVRASADHLQQVLLNLLTNARDAMPGGGTITLRTARDEGRVVAEVRDSGPGLAPEVEAHLFEPFFTTKETGKGTGLGLSVSHGIVSAHGGELDGANAPEGGALFRVRLPAADA